MKRIIDIEDKKVMIVSDIHGSQHDFERIMVRFNYFKETGQADQLLFLGDIIHSFNYKKDASIRLLDTLIDKGCNQPGSDLICLLGNHELVHLFHIPLRKGNWEFNKGLEWKMAKDRRRYHQFFCQMPIAVRLSGGVLINHTGAAPYYNEKLLTARGLSASFWREWNFNSITETYFSDEVVEQMKQRYLPDCGYDLMEQEVGKLLWESYMNGNEKQYAAQTYFKMIDEMLAYYSWDRVAQPLKWLVSGHIGVDWGVETVGENQLRICSSAGCPLDLEKKILILDAKRAYESLSHLKEGLQDVY